MGKRIGKTKNIIISFFLNSIVIGLLFIMVANVFSACFPILSRFDAPHIRSHSSLEEGVLLSESIDVQPNFAFFLIFHAEIEPLTVPIRIGVHLHVQIVL